MEKRIHERKPATGTIRLSLLREDLALKGKGDVDVVLVEIVDLSVGGFGLLTDVSLEPGQRVRVLDKDRGWELPENGIIVWTTESPEGCRAGVKFI